MLYPSFPVLDKRYQLRVVGAEQCTLWDQFVTEHPQGHFLQSWGWGELKASSGWRPLRLALWDTQTDKESIASIVAAAQVLQRTASHVPLRAGHLAYIPRGPVLDWAQPSLYTNFLTQLHTCLRRQGALSLRMELSQHTENAPQTLITTLKTQRFSPARAIQPLRTILLDITPDEQALLARMKEKWRYNVRLAAKKGVTVRVAQTEADVQAWYALMQTTSERDAFGIHTADYYLQAWKIFFPRNQARLLLAEYDGQLLAGIFVTLFAKQAIYLYGASSNELRNLMPNYLLQWEAIRWAKAEGATSYDFWGIPETESEDEAMAGVYRFKAGWGGEVVRFLGCYEYIYRPLAMRLARNFISL